VILFHLLASSHTKGSHRMSGSSAKQRSWSVPNLVFLAVAGIACSSVRAAEPVDERHKPAIRIVNCDQNVQSRKRGICANEMAAADFRAVAPGVSWYYNWGAKPLARPAEVEMEYLPMAWNQHEGFLTALESYLAAGHKPRCLLAINEPNLRGQAFLTPQQTAAAYAKIKLIADKYRIPLVGPHMALGSPPQDSIQAMDPIEKKELTYTFMVPFLKAFLFYTDQQKTEVTATALHSYGNVGELKWAVALMRKEFRRPVWVTEYSYGATPYETLTYLIQATDFLERTPYVQGYAWFKERLDEKGLLATEPGKLTPLGHAYVALPVHDPDLYYRIPGRLQAERYVTIDKMEIWPTNDPQGGLAHMAATDPGASIDYSIQVDTAGAYTLRFRVSGPAGECRILQGERVLGTVAIPPAGAHAWQTVGTSVQFPAGPQTLRIRCESKGLAINWIEFAQLGG
jgi:hypothetical protein